jgi:hypothetical protein
VARFPVEFRRMVTERARRATLLEEGTRPMATKFTDEMFEGFDCRPDFNRETGIKTPDWIAAEIEKRKPAREAAAKAARKATGEAPTT